HRPLCFRDRGALFATAVSDFVSSSQLCASCCAVVTYSRRRKTPSASWPALFRPPSLPKHDVDGHAGRGRGANPTPVAIRHENQCTLIAVSMLLSRLSTA